MTRIIIDSLAVRPRIGKHAYLDQAMGLEAQVSLFVNGIGQTIGANDDDRVQVMGFATLFFAFGGRQVQCRHPRIIPLQ